MFYIDSHCHLTDKRYESTEKIVRSALDKNVALLVDIGWSEESTSLASRNAEKFDNVYFTAGIHPSESLSYNDKSLRFVESFLKKDKCLAVGEIGLDYHYPETDEKSQSELFESQIYLAYRNDLPIVVHSRDASKKVLDILTCNKNYLQKGFLMHCYSESREQAKNYLDLGGFFAFGGVVTFKNAKKEEIVKSIPRDRILAETDAPYMAPEPMRGRINYPEYVLYVYKKLAEIYGVDTEVFAETVMNNFKTFFKKVRL